MSEILVCPVCGKEYQSKYYYEKHVAAHEAEVEIPEIEKMAAEVPVLEVVDEEGETLLEVVNDVEPEPVFDPEKAKVMAKSALTKLSSFMAILGLHLDSQREKWNDAIGDLKAAIDFL